MSAICVFRLCKPMAKTRHIIAVLWHWPTSLSFAKGQNCALFSHCFVELNESGLPVALIMGSSMPWCMVLCRLLAIMVNRLNRLVHRDMGRATLASE